MKFALPTLLTLVVALSACDPAALQLAGSGASGGIFSPSLFMGATLGGSLGSLVQVLWPGLGVSPVMMAVIGMAAVSVNQGTMTLGDFILVNGVFGRVSRRSLVSTRIQTETRDFTNLPNLLLVTQPVTVQHRDGTIIQADVSLGYDVHHNTVERELLAWAAALALTLALLSLAER